MAGKTVYVFRDGKWVDKDSAPPIYIRSDAPYVIPDEMDPLKHPCNQQIITSKHKFRDVTRAAGYEEVGNEYGYGRKSQSSERQIRDDICRSIEILNSKR